MLITINPHSLLVFTVSVFVGSFAVIMYCGSKNTSAKIFSVGAGLYCVWSTNIGLLISTQDQVLGQFLGRLSYFLGSLIVSTFLIFFYVFPKERKVPKKIIYAAIITEIIFFISYFFSNLMLGKFTFDYVLHFWTWQLMPPALLFDLYFLSVFVFGIKSIIRHYKQETDGAEKKNLVYIIIVVIIGIIPPAIFDISLHWFGIFKFNWVGPITGVFWVMVLGYSILKYQQMNVKLAFSEMFVMALNIIFFVNIFLNVSVGTFGRAMLAIMFCALGYQLVRLIGKDNEQSEMLDILNKRLASRNFDLEEKVVAQTKEIRKAYEVEKKAKEEIEKLDQNKSDFIIITQHHLRTPLSQIRWYLDSLSGGLYGPVSKEISVAVENITKVTEKLSKILNHFLDISRLKVGHNILNVESVDLKNLVASVLNDLRADLKKKMITVKLLDDSWPEVICDPEKIKDVFLIVLDNSIKYNKEGGEIGISGTNSKKGFVVTVSNTGLSLSKTDLESIFKDSFYRSAEAKRMNPTGMGVSLLVARTIMLAHKGSISLDQDKQSRASVSIEFKC